jgi:hypothetical protein
MLQLFIDCHIIYLYYIYSSIHSQNVVTLIKYSYVENKAAAKRSRSTERATQIVKVKGKVRPRTDHEGPEGE